jgi:hypothetical protein
MGNPPPPPLPPPPLPNNGNDVLDTGGIGWGVFALNVIFIIFYIQSSYKIDFKPKYITPSYYNTTHQNVSTIINNTNIHLSNMQQNETV